MVFSTSERRPSRRLAAFRLSSGEGEADRARRACVRDRFHQDHKRSAAKQGLFDDMNAGKKRILIGSSETMGTWRQRPQTARRARPSRRAGLRPEVAQREGLDRAPGQPERRDRALRLPTKGSVDATAGRRSSARRASSTWPCRRSVDPADLNLIAEAIGDDCLGFHLSQKFELRMAGITDHVPASSDSLGEALRRLARYSSIVNEGIKLTFSGWKVDWPYV